MQEDTLRPAVGLKDESQLVTFLLKDEEFGFDIMTVQEIIRLPKMAKVPRMPAYVDGIANLRGVVLPVIDMRTRFGIERATETDRTRVLVVDIDGDQDRFARGSGKTSFPRDAQRDRTAAGCHPRDYLGLPGRGGEARQRTAHHHGPQCGSGLRYRNES